MSDLLIYGATGYTGQLAVERAVATGLRPVLAGRSEQKLRPLAERHDCEWRAFDLNAAAGIRGAIADASAVLHMAGPFSKTALPMADACINAGVHYIDITGEISVFEALAARDREAKSAAVMLL